MNIYSLKNIIERYWDRIQNSQSRRWLINGCKWSSFLAMQYSNSTDLKPPIWDFVLKGLSFSQTIPCYSKKMPLPVRFASAESLAHCHYDTAETVFIHEGERNTSAERSPSPPYLIAWIHFASSLHLSFRIACLQANIQAKLGWSSRYRHLHTKFPCALLYPKPSSRSGKHLVSATKKSPDKGVSLCVMKSAWPVQDTAQTNNAQVSPTFKIRKGKRNATIVEAVGKLASGWKALVWGLIFFWMSAVTKR